ncbi:hypothetical protein BT69DRAFT_350794 [Atractiella rhizophila]|nr:hypothetical protein BT69DRAFT_350794 [Atractiella rhizophila]
MDALLSFLTDLHSDPRSAILLPTFTDLIHQLPLASLAGLFDALPLLSQSQQLPAIFHAISRGLTLRIKALKLQHPYSYSLRWRIAELVGACVAVERNELVLHAALLNAMEMEGVVVERKTVEERLRRDLILIRGGDEKALECARVVGMVEDLLTRQNWDDPLENEAIVNWLLPSLSTSLSSPSPAPELPLLAQFVSRLLPPLLPLLPSILSTFPIQPTPTHQTLPPTRALHSDPPTFSRSLAGNHAVERIYRQHGNDFAAPRFTRREKGRYQRFVEGPGTVRCECAGGS